RRAPSTASTSTGRSLPSRESWSYATQVQTTSPGSGRPSTAGVYSGVGSSGLRFGQVGGGRSDDLVEDRLRQRAAFPANSPWLEHEHPVETHLAGPPLAIPGSRPDVHPDPAGVRLLRRIDVVVLARQRQCDNPGRITGDDQD